MLVFFVTYNVLLVLFNAFHLVQVGLDVFWGSCNEYLKVVIEFQDVVR